MSHWPDRDIAEWGVARLFTEIASAEPGYPFSEPRARGKGNDPPDCEALDNDGRLIAFEITELVDGQAIAETKRAAMKGSGLNRWAEWSPARIREEIQARLGSKDRKTLQGGAYAEYIVLLHTDEPALVLQTIENALDGYRFAPPGRVDRAYLLLSYDPTRDSYPFVRLL